MSMLAVVVQNPFKYVRQDSFTSKTTGKYTEANKIICLGVYLSIKQIMTALFPRSLKKILHLMIIPKNQ